MINDEPIAFYITWTIYGAHLPGDARGWRLRGAGSQKPQPLLARWHERRLKHSVLVLDARMRNRVESECEKHCRHRGWEDWAINARTDHVHVVVTAIGYSGKQVRDQLKANCTRGLREQWGDFLNRPVWAVGGDWDCINTEDDLEAVILYVREAQDRKYLDAQKR